MEHKMSTFSETITLTNARDRINARTGLIPQSKVRTQTVKACVDTGSWFLVLNEETRAALGLKLTGIDTATLADGTIREFPVTEPVEFQWKDRKKSMEALVLPDAKQVLFGALCMEALDVMADPVGECLVGRHGDKAMYQVYSLK
jgi:predicted aspartyl protease